MPHTPTLALVALATLGACTGSGPAECTDNDKITVYADSDRDGYGAPGTEKLVCPPLDADGNPTAEIPRGFSSNDDDCDDFRSSVNPGAIEVCDGLDNDCDGQVDEGLRSITFYIDADGDGFGDADTSLAVAACAPPVGYVDNPDDCDDGNAAVNPDAVEVCDNIDNDCDRRVDDGDPKLDLSTAPTWYLDADGDSFGGDADTRVQCTSPGPDFVLNQDDCDDADDRVNPSATEVCNRIDDDCDNLIDDSDPDLDPATQTLWYADVDNDGYGDPDVTTMACFRPWFYVDNPDDCDDNEPLLGLPAEWVRDTDADGFGAGTPSSPSCVPPDADWVLLALGIDCDDTNPFVNPLGNEVCDGIDNDCDGLIDDEDPSLDPILSFSFYADLDGDLFGDPDVEFIGCAAPLGYVEDDQDCNDQDPDINPDATEVCDGADNDCDGLIDDQDPDLDLESAPRWWADFDEDGFGNPSIFVDACIQPANYVDNGLDCDDTDPEVLVLGTWLFDNDGDGVGAGTPSAPSCTAPAEGWVPSWYGEDCDDDDPTRFPGNLEICNNGNDEDCDGIDPPCTLLFAPPQSELDPPRWERVSIPVLR